MRPNKRLIALTLSAVLLLSVVGPGLAMAEEHPEDEVSELNVAVDDLTVSVTDGNETAVENASVNVTLDDENATYNGTGDYSTDENGTVDLPAPDETVNVTVTAEKDNATASTTATLEAPEGDETEEENGGANDAFGQELQDQLWDLLNGEGADFPPGQNVAQWVTDNNPGNAPDHAGPKDDTGPPEDAGPDGDQGPPEHAGPDGDNGPSDDVEADEEDNDEEEEADDDDTDDSNETDDSDE